LDLPLFYILRISSQLDLSHGTYIAIPIMALTKDQLVALHQNATQLLHTKLARIPKRVFTTGNYPTIHEYYTKASTLNVPSIPEQYQLEYLLGKYNAFATVDFKAIKTPGTDIDIAKAIWYWQTDSSHSFNRLHSVIRHNIIIAVIVGASANPGAYCTGAAQQFLFAFIHAWKESVLGSSSFTARDAFLKLWAEGQYDVVQWRSKQSDAMRRAVKELRGKVPELPFPANEFWERVRQQPDAEWEKHGHAWATQWVVHMEKEGERAANQKTGDAYMDGMEAGLSGLGVGEAPEYLCEELFEQQHVRALLQDIEVPAPGFLAASASAQAPASTPTLPKEHKLDVRAMWMDPSAAIDLVRGLDGTAVDGLEGALKNMSFIT
jgi:hypothetical protein